MAAQENLVSGWYGVGTCASFAEGSTRDSNFLLPLPPRPRAAGPGGGGVRCGAVRCGVVWCGVVWCGVCGVVRCVVWCAGEMQAACSVLLS